MASVSGRCGAHGPAVDLQSAPSAPPSHLHLRLHLRLRLHLLRRLRLHCVTKFAAPLTRVCAQYPIQHHLAIWLKRARAKSSVIAHGSRACGNACLLQLFRLSLATRTRVSTCRPEFRRWLFNHRSRMLSLTSMRPPFTTIVFRPCVCSSRGCQDASDA